LEFIWIYEGWGQSEEASNASPWQLEGGILHEISGTLLDAKSNATPSCSRDSNAYTWLERRAWSTFIDIP
jgi:hypothetical protein